MLTLTNDTIVTLNVNRYQNNTLNVSVKGTANQVIEYLKSINIHLENDNNFIHFLSQLKNTFNSQNTNGVSCSFNDNMDKYQIYPIVDIVNPVKYINL